MLCGTSSTTVSCTVPFTCCPSTTSVIAHPPRPVNAGFPFRNVTRT
jgi:hypothetical protein